ADQLASRSVPDQDVGDWPSYPETILRFLTEPSLEIDLRQHPSSGLLRQLAAVGFAEPFAVVTAFDPKGRDLSPRENERRKQDLDRRLKAGGYRFAHVNACSPDHSHCECRVAVLMPQDKSISLARVREQ